MANAKKTTTFWGELLSLQPYKPKQGRLVRQLTTAGVALVSLLGTMSLSQGPLADAGDLIRVGVPALPARLDIAPSDWLPLVTGFGRLFHRVAGAPRSLMRLGNRHRFRPGRATLLGR